MFRRLNETCSCCLSTRNTTGVMTTIYSLQGITQTNAGFYTSKYEERFICEDCCDWSWITLNEAIDSYTLVNPVSMVDWYPEWMIGRPDEFMDFPIGSDSPWFQAVLAGVKNVDVYLSGDADSIIDLPF